MHDCYAKEHSSSVKSVSGNTIELDDTIFYPTSGGQPHDKGTITRVSDNKMFSVVNVSKNENRIEIELSEPGLSEGDHVKEKIDWEYRLKLMRMHTAAHLLGAVIEQDGEFQYTGSQLGEDKSRIDVDIPNYDVSKVKVWEVKLNDIVQRKIEMTLKVLPREEAFAIPQICKLKKMFPDHIQTIRIVEIPGVDIQACGGTHLKNTAEIGKFEIMKVDNKGKANRRITFRVV